MSVVDGWTADRTREIATRFVHERGALLPALHALQEADGYIDPRAVPVLADVLNLSRAEVHGVISFYRDFRGAPPGRRILKVCRAEACQAVGGDELAAHAQRMLGIRFGETSADGAITLDQVFCLGNCALGPSVMMDDRVVGRVDAATLEQWLESPLAAPSLPDVDHAPNAGSEASGGGAGVGWLRRPTPVEAEPAEPTRGAGILRRSEPTNVVATLYVPDDASARAVGADEVALAIAAEARSRGVAVDLVRHGTRGMLWLEPLVEVVTPRGRVAYGPVAPSDVVPLFEAGFLEGGEHALALGVTDDIPALARQRRITFARVGVIDPLSADEYEALGGLAGLRRALTMTPEEIVDELVESGLRGRGGAGFPAGIKWRTVLEAPTGERFVCANADEGDSGTFADRMLIEGDPFALVEGMLIAAYVIGAREGFVYVRSEYPDAIAKLESALAIARRRGWLGESVLGSDVAFDISVRVGAGAYICGEETAMLESIEGKRGVVRAKPPLPAIEGLFARPTIVNNVLTLASVPPILAGGASTYAALGRDRSRGTQVFQLAGNVVRGGIVEVPFGITLGELVDEIGGGTRSGRPVRAVQVGGPLGAYFPRSSFDLPMDYEALGEADGLLGHGGLVVFDDTVDLARQARFAMEFCAEESCGKCTPCRIGAVRGVELMDGILTDDRRASNLELLEELCEVMVDGSLCAMGGLTPVPVRSALRHFGEDFKLSN